MNKKIFALALAAIAAIGVSASAQTDNNNTNNTTCDQQCDQQCDNQPTDKRYRPQRFQDFAFEGILLDIPQQARIDSLNNAVKAQREQVRAERQQKGSRADKAKRGENGDSAAVVAPWRNPRDFGGQRGPRRVSKDYVAKVKEILTPEQYTVFLENLVFMPENAAPQQNDKAMRQDRGRKQAADKMRAHQGNRKDMKKGQGRDPRKAKAAGQQVNLNL